jgi:DNA-binding MarR family transcriptional regulator
VPPFAFLTNHGRVLLCIAEDPEQRMRDIAAHTDITERAAQRIVADLVATGYLSRTREGRRNRYHVRTDLPVALAAQRDIDLGSLLEVLLPTGSTSSRREAIAGAATP